MAKLRIANSCFEKEEDEKEEEPFEKVEKFEAIIVIAQNEPKVANGEKILIGPVKDSFFNTENMKKFFNSPLFDTSVKNSCGLAPLYGEPSAISIIFPSFPYETTTTKLSKVGEEVPRVYTPSLPPTNEHFARSIESKLKSMEKQVKKISFVQNLFFSNVDQLRKTLN